MCLMCMSYRDHCSEPGCVEAAKEYVKTHPGDEAYYRSRSGLELFLWQGFGMPPCEHIAARHGPECEVYTDHFYCNCYFDKEDGVWIYD